MTVSADATSGRRFDEFRALAREYTVVPGLARGARRSRDAAVGVREARRRRRRVPARVGRARRALGAVLVPRPRPGAHVRRRAGGTSNGSAATPPDGVPSRPGNARGARSAPRALSARRRCPSCRRSTAASSGGWATTPCARSSGCPTSPPDDLGFPDAVCSLAGQRRRVRPLPPAAVPDRERVPAARMPTTRRSTRCTTAAVARLDNAVADLGRPLPYTPAVPPADELDELPEVRRNFGSRRVGRRGRTPRRSTSSTATSSRSCSRSASISSNRSIRSSVYRVLRLVNPSPYMYFLRHPEATIVGSSPEALVQVRRRPRDQPSDRRAPAGAAATTEHDRRLEAELVEHPKERAEHVMLVDLARNDVGRVVQLRHRAGRGADDARAVLARHAPDEPGRG